MAPLAHELRDNCRYFAVPGAATLPRAHWPRARAASCDWLRRRHRGLTADVAEIEKLSRRPDSCDCITLSSRYAGAEVVMTTIRDPS